MLRVNDQKWRCVLLLVGAVALSLVAVSAQADTISFNGNAYNTIFVDEFNDNGVDTTKWNITTNNGGVVYQGGSGAVVIDTWGAAAKTARMLSKNGQLAGLATSNDWLIQSWFNVNPGKLSSFNTAPAPRQYLLLQGTTDVSGGDTWASLGIDLRLQQIGDDYNASTYNLAWYGFDNIDSNRVATVLATLTKGVNYGIDLHRNSDNTVDIYLNNNGAGPVLIANKPLISATYTESGSGSVTSDTPKCLMMGDMTSTSNEAYVVWYRMSVATAVPEPSTIVMLVMSAFGLLAYAWRKRK